MEEEVLYYLNVEDLGMVVAYYLMVVDLITLFPYEAGNSMVEYGVYLMLIGQLMIFLVYSMVIRLIWVIRVMVRVILG